MPRFASRCASTSATVCECSFSRNLLKCCGSISCSFAISPLLRSRIFFTCCSSSSARVVPKASVSKLQRIVRSAPHHVLLRLQQPIELRQHLGQLRCRNIAQSRNLLRHALHVVSPTGSETASSPAHPQSRPSESQPSATLVYPARHKPCLRRQQQRILPHRLHILTSASLFPLASSPLTTRSRPPAAVYSAPAPVEYVPTHAQRFPAAVDEPCSSAVAVTHLQPNPFASPIAALPAASKPLPIPVSGAEPAANIRAHAASPSPGSPPASAQTAPEAPRRFRSPPFASGPAVYATNHALPPSACPSSEASPPERSC